MEYEVDDDKFIKFIKIVLGTICTTVIFSAALNIYVLIKLIVFQAEIKQCNDINIGRLMLDAQQLKKGD